MNFSSVPLVLSLGVFSIACGLTILLDSGIPPVVAGIIIFLYGLFVVDMRPRRR